MDSAYAPICWIRGNGQRIAVESMTDREVLEGREYLDSIVEDNDPVGLALLEAIHQEARGRGL